jgi:hypothetical protein
MVVWREHDADPPDAIRAHLLERLREVADQRFGDSAYRIDDHMRNIPDHFHAHARDHGFWTRFGVPERHTIPRPDSAQP